MKDHNHYTKKALDDLLKLGERLSNKRRHLSDILPMRSTAKVDRFQATKIHFCRCQFLLPLLLWGVFGTCMGLYNRWQQKRLQTEMQSTIKLQKHLVEITCSNSQNISILQTQIADLKWMTAALTLSSPVAVIMNRTRNLRWNWSRRWCRSNRSVETSLPNVTFWQPTPQIILRTDQMCWSSTGQPSTRKPFQSFSNWSFVHLWQWRIKCCHSHPSYTYGSEMCHTSSLPFSTFSASMLGQAFSGPSSSSQSLRYLLQWTKTICWPDWSWSGRLL